MSLGVLKNQEVAYIHNRTTFRQFLALQRKQPTVIKSNDGITTAAKRQFWN